MTLKLQDIQQLAQLSLDDLLKAYRATEIDPLDVHELTMQQIERVNPQINALYAYDAAVSRQQAKDASLRWKSGSTHGMLDGVPVTIKDSIAMRATTWHHGSAAHGQGQVLQVDAPCVERLRQAQAMIIAKTTMSDFGATASGVSSFYGITRNPWQLDLSPGGSSSGAGASLAAGIGLFALGTDIAGSVRLPAAQCGLAAIKPTHGLIAHTPASNIRSVGIMARSARDLASALRVVSGVHPRDRYSVPLWINTALPANMRIKSYLDFGFGQPVDVEIEDCFERCCASLRQQGFAIAAGAYRYDFDVYASIDDLLKRRTWFEYMHAEQAQHFPEALKRWCAGAEHMSATHIMQGQAEIEAAIEQTQHLFEDAEVIMTPVSPVLSFAASALGPDQHMPLRHCNFCAPFNQSGHPAVVIHAGLSSTGLPIGIQLVGQRFSDLLLIQLAVRIEQQLRAQNGPIAWPLQPQALASV